MPDHFRRSALALLLTGLLGTSALAASKPDSASKPAPVAAAAASPAASAATPENSGMDAPLFYQLLVGEMELNSGQPGVAYQVLLDAARRSSDAALFQRVIGIALQARAGDQALIAAKAWRQSIPDSIEAQQTTIQLLAVLNRPAEIAEPLAALLALTPAEQRGGVLASLPRLFARSPDLKGVAAALEPPLQAAGQQPETRIAALYTRARLAQMAGDNERALGLTRELAQAAPDTDEPMQLALDLLPSTPAAEALITAELQAKPGNSQLRLAYGRALARAQRAGDAAREFRKVTELSPKLPSAWFVLGALELDLRHTEAADAALREYLRRLAESPEGEAAAADESRQQTWLMLSQVAELKGDLKEAEDWLKKVDSPQRQLEAQYRRASLLARQGRLSDARKLIQALPETSDEQARSKLLAESQLLRDAQDWQAAYEVLKRANTRFPDDPDLLYEESMMSEKLGRNEEMEQLLRRVIALKPDHHHAYNALGYSLADRNVRLDEARGLITEALSLAPAEPFIVDSMGWVEYRSGNKDEALRLLRQAYQARPDTEIAAHLGEVLWVAGQQDEARRVWQEGARRDPKNDALRETLQRLKAKL
ncbi:MAG: tetratricopeptide repeat protein [Burkholderiaceae bacterium]